MDKQLDWSRLEAIATPEKWLKMYQHYEELLTQSDVAAWYADQFNICCRERDELKVNLNNWDYVNELYYKHVSERYG